MTPPRTEQMLSVGETREPVCFCLMMNTAKPAIAESMAVIPNWISMASSRKPRHSLLPEYLRHGNRAKGDRVNDQSQHRRNHRGSPQKFPLYKEYRCHCQNGDSPEDQSSIQTPAVSRLEFV